MSKDIGTLQEIGAKVGDTVEWIGRSVKLHLVIGSIVDGDYYEVNNTDSGLSAAPYWRIISRANQGPVREVTTVRKEIVPGVYGAVEVRLVEGKPQTVCIGIMQYWESFAGVDKGLAIMSRDELTAAIDTLTAIRDAMLD